MGSVGRRTAVVAASSGLIVSMIGAAAPASGIAESAPSDKPATIDVGGRSAGTRDSVESAPTVSVPADATFVIEAAVVTVTPAPTPEPEVVETREERTSRTEDRAAEATETVAEEVTQAEPTSSAPASAYGSEIISIAGRYVGVPYVYGGSTPDGFDCSGFTSYVFEQVGISLPRTSGGQGQMGTRVSRDEAQPGDLIWTPGHIAIYAGDGMMIDASRPGESIQFRAIWQSNPTFIRLG